MTPTVLLYNLDNEKGRKIKALCLTLRLRARSVPEEDFSQPLESLLGLALRREDAREGEAFPDELLVMAGLSTRQAEGLLQGLRRKKAPVALKAVLTASNAGWDGCRLYRELREEHQAMLRGERLHQEEGE